MEGRWVVADVDAYEEEDADEGADEDEDVNSLSQLSPASEFKVKGGMPRIVRVSGAKNDIVNGMHHLLAMTRHVAISSLPTGPWVRPQGLVVHRAGTPPSSLSPSRGRRRRG